jgi:adenylate cyclase
LEAHRVERKLSAIFAADVEGYSRLMGRNEVGTLHTLTAYRVIIDRLIASHRGRIFNTAGDSILADFASAVDAVQCAVAMQEAMGKENSSRPAGEQMRFRIGIHVGDIIVQGDNLFGDAVNVAARLEALAEPGGICVSGAVQDHIGTKLPIEFIDLGPQQVKNITQPIKAYRIRSDTAVIETRAVGSYLPLPDKPSIAVLPFANMSSDPEQEYFADGMVEEIITALSRYPSLFVIARNSSFTYKGHAVNVTQVGRELGVRYVLEGSLRKSGTRIRVTAQLVEAESGKHVWAERYDRDLFDIFAVQDEITEAVAIAVVPAIADAELHRAMRKLPSNLDAWAAYQRGLWNLDKATSDHNLQAEKFFQQAVDLDPTFADGYCGLAVAQMRAVSHFQTRVQADIRSSAEPLVRRAVSLDGNNAVAFAWLSYALYMRGDPKGAVAEAERALALSPNLALGYWRRATALIFSGRPSEGLAGLRVSLRLEPRGANLAPRLTQVAIGYYFSRAYEEAVEAAKQVIRVFPDFPPPYPYLAAAIGQLGHSEEAKVALDEAIAIAPGWFEMYVRNRAPWWRLEDHGHMVDGLRKAGLPQG